MDHRNVVLENFFSDIGDVMLVRNVFIPIGVINRTTSQPIWTPTCEDIGHIAKSTSSGPPKKIPTRSSDPLGQWLVSCAFLWSCLGSFFAASVGSRTKGDKEKTYDCKKDQKNLYGFDYSAFEFDIAVIIIFSTTPKYFNKNLLTMFELNTQIFSVD